MESSTFTSASMNVTDSVANLTTVWESISTTAMPLFNSSHVSLLSSVISNLTNSSNTSFADISTDPLISEISVAGSEAASGEHSKGAFYAWIGLGILLCGIVFILGFVFVFDKFLRKKFFGPATIADPEAGRDQTDSGKKPTDMVVGEPNLPEAETAKKVSIETEKNGSSESLSKRKRQEKVDETNEVELKPL